MEAYIAAAELAGLPGMPSTRSGVIRRGKAEHWRKRARAGRGGGWEYLVADLPEQTRAHLLAAALKTAPAVASAPSAAVIPLPGAVGARRQPASGALSTADAVPAALPALPADASDTRALAEYQRQIAMARMTVLHRVRDIVGGLGVSVETAIEHLNKHVAAEPDDVIAKLVRKANARPREDGPALTRQTYYRWAKEAANGGFARLAPLPTRYERLPDWAMTLLRLYQRPTKPSLADCVRELPAALAADGITCEPPSYAAARRFVDDKVGRVAIQVGRMGPRALRTRLPFVRRSFDDLKPGDIYTADGHTFKAQIAHPDRPGAFRPEITPVLDVATRKCVGVSVGMNENQWDVLGALERAFRTHGVCAIFYVDRGPGFDNNLQKDELVGMGPRLGYEVKHSIPYNSQARGVIERFHSSVLVPLARRFESGITGGDKQHLQKVHQLVTKAQRQHGVRVALPSMDEFVAELLRAIDDYNARVHRSLKGQSPSQRWDQAINSGWQVTPLGEDIEQDLFWPRTVCTVRRGEVRFRGKTYFDLGLTEFDGLQVVVSFNVADPAQVVVRDFQHQRWICAAQLDGNVRPYYPQSVLAEAREKSAEAAVKRAQRKVDVKQAELDRVRAIEHAPSPVANFIDVTPTPAEEVVPARPTFQFKGDRYEWLMAHRSEWTDDDLAWVRRFVATEDYGLLADRWDALGITWKESGGEAPSFKAAD